MAAILSQLQCVKTDSYVWNHCKYYIFVEKVLLLSFVYFYEKYHLEFKSYEMCNVDFKSFTLYSVRLSQQVSPNLDGELIFYIFNTLESK